VLKVVDSAPEHSIQQRVCIRNALHSLLPAPVAAASSSSMNAARRDISRRRRINSSIVSARLSSLREIGTKCTLSPVTSSARRYGLNGCSGGTPVAREGVNAAPRSSAPLHAPVETCLGLQKRLCGTLGQSADRIGGRQRPQPPSASRRCGFRSMRSAVASAWQQRSLCVLSLAFVMPSESSR
jgi:hypothetical protein